MAPPAADTASILSSSTGISGRRAASSIIGPNFTLDTFSSKDFIVKDFVESLSESAIPANRRSAPVGSQAAFDPKPLIRAFEAALQRLGSLSEELESRENELSAAVRRAEAQHMQNTANLSSRLESAIEEFNQLEGTLNGSSIAADYSGDATDALRIGERLEELEKQRQRAQDAKFLIQCWLEVSEKGNLSTLEDMRRMGGGDSKVRCASIARKLLRISHRLGVEGTPQMNGASRSNGVNGVNGRKTDNTPTRVIIEKFLEGLEQDLLKQFDNHYRRQNFEGMKECAIALRDFNEGSNVISLFVNQHQFFIDRSQLITEELGDNETWDRIADPDTEPPGVDPGLQSLIDEVRLVVQEESFIIKRAFPYHDEVLIRFLQRVFQQSIQQRLEMVLEKAESISTLAFLRSLQASRSYISNLVDDLKAHGLTEHPEPASSQIAATLDQQLDDLFVPYFIGSSYIEREKKNLSELYSSLLFKFTTYHSRRKKLPTTYLDRLGQRGKELMNQARDAYMERLDSTDLPSSQKAMLLRIAGLKDTDSGRKENEIEVTEEDGQLSLPNAKRMLKWLAEGVGRGLELSGGNETPKDVQALLSLLLTSMGEIYLDSALESAADLATAQEASKTEPDLSYLPSLRTAIQILHLLQTSINTLLLPLAAPNLSIRRDIDKTSTAQISALENKISSILHRTLDASLAWAGKLLQSQKKTDFRPRDEDLAQAIEALQTPTCLAIYTFLTRVANLAYTALDGFNLSSFLAELASGLRSLLLDHFRKFAVSLTGGLIVSKDVTKYTELVRDWPLQGTQFQREGGMEVLVEVANLFVIGPDALRERLKGSAATVRTPDEVAELRKYVERREDANSVGVQAVLSSL